jgi:hypothetical protein
MPIEVEGPSVADDPAVLAGLATRFRVAAIAMTLSVWRGKTCNRGQRAGPDGP